VTSTKTKGSAMVRTRILAALAAAALAVSGCTGPLQGVRVQDAHGNTAGCAEPTAVPTGPLARPTSFQLRCWASPPPPSISPSPVVSVSQSPVPSPAGPLPNIRGGYYLGGNANMAADVAGMNLESFTQYRSLGSRLVFPGWEPSYGYLRPWVNGGVAGNFVVELVCFQTADCAAKSFQVEGVTYVVPAGNSNRNHGGCGGRAQQASLGYGQLASGHLDGLLHTALAQTREFTGPLVFHLYSEVDTDAECGTVEGGVFYDRTASNARAAAAAAYAISWLRNPCAFEPAPCTIAPAGPNVSFTVGMGGFHPTSYNQVYTPAVRGLVDFYNVNTYWRHAGSSWKTELGVDLANVRKAGWPIHPVLITEFGTPVTAASGTWTTTQAARIEQFPAAVRDVNRAADGDADVVIANYFNSNNAWATLNPKADGLAALRRAYDDPLFSVQGE